MKACRIDRRRPARTALRPSTDQLEARLCMSAGVPPWQAFAGVTEADLITQPRPLHAEVHAGQHAATHRAVHALVSASGRHATPHRHPPGYSRESLHEDPGPQFDPASGSGPGAGRQAGLSPGIMSTGWTPPDDNIAVGPDNPGKTEVVEAVNEQLAFFGKDGTVINSTSQIGLNTNLFPNALGGSVFDPRIVFDPANGGHYLLTALEQSSSSRSSYLDIAVSKTSTPSTASTSDWYTHRIAIGQQFGRTSTWMDFDGLGFDSQALYVSGNMFGFGGSGAFQGVKIVTFDKNQLELGPDQGLSAPAKTMIRTDGAFGLQPAVTLGSAPAEYFIESWSPNGTSQVRIHAITNPLGTGSLTDTTTTLAVPAFGTGVPSAPQRGSSNKIATNDTRILNAVWLNGSLWATHTIKNPSTGLATARWYQVSTAGTSPALAGSGNIDPGNGVSTFFPSITTDSSGSVAISYAESSANEYPSASYTVRPAGGTSFLPASSPNLQAGAAPYGGSRWGDYSGVAADPSHPGIFYAVGEATQGNGNWGTWWTLASPPVTSQLAAPTNLSATAESSGPILLSWNPVPGATSYKVYRSDSPSTPLIQAANAQTSVENTNVQPGTTYTYTVVASNSNPSYDSPPSNSATATAATPNAVFQYINPANPASTSFPGSSWTTVGGTWSQTTTTDSFGNIVGGTLSQTSTAPANVEKAIVKPSVTLNSSGVIITAEVHIDSWNDGELARAGIGLFTDPSTGKGYNLVLTGRFSNTGNANTIAQPHLDFLDDLVAWGSDVNLSGAVPPIQVGPGSPSYWFQMEIRNGVLYGSFWQDGSAQPATWMISQAGWTDHPTGSPSLNGGDAGTSNNVSSSSTASFTNVAVTQ
jgi:hypothetical protein